MNEEKSDRILRSIWLQGLIGVLRGTIYFIIVALFAVGLDYLIGLIPSKEPFLFSKAVLGSVAPIILILDLVGLGVYFVIELTVSVYKSVTVVSLLLKFWRKKP